MVRLSESVRVHAAPEKAWEIASDLSRLGEWMTMHEAWRGDVPSELGEGTTLTSVVSVKGLRNRIAWHITSYYEPRELSLAGEGVGGTKISLVLSIRPDGDGSRIEFDVDFSGKMLFGPVGMTVKRALKGQVHDSVENLQALID